MGGILGGAGDHHDDGLLDHPSPGGGGEHPGRPSDMGSSKASK